jgi:hypothetical protein
VSLRNRFVIALSLSVAIGCSLVVPPREKVARGPQESGRELVRAALEPPKRARTLGRAGVVATALASADLRGAATGIGHALKEFDPRKEPAEVFRLELRDGTVVGGLLYPWKGDPARLAPLWISSFGFLQDRWGSESAKVTELYGAQGLGLAAHHLVLDHPTSGAFYGQNGMLSMGAYDDARMWIEVAQHVRSRLKVSTIHLLGVSMSGQTVVHALIEDARLGLDLFDSGIAVSIAPDLQQAPGCQLARLETRDGETNPWSCDAEGPAGSEGRLMKGLQRRAIWTLMQEQFVSSYRTVRPDDDSFTVEREDVALFLRQTTEARIGFLGRHQSGTWSDRFSLADLDAFMDSTRIADVIAAVRTPLVLLSAKDDPAVDRSMFVEVERAAAANPWVLAHETAHGGHFGFNVAYGPEYLYRILLLLMDEGVIGHWTGGTAHTAAAATTMASNSRAMVGRARVRSNQP